MPRGSRAWAREVNTVFNYLPNELSVKVFERERRFLSGIRFSGRSSKGSRPR